jgi:hypothetical protein
MAASPVACTCTWRPAACAAAIAARSSGDARGIVLAGDDE